MSQLDIQAYVRHPGTDFVVLLVSDRVRVFSPSMHPTLPQFRLDMEKYEKTSPFASPRSFAANLDSSHSFINECRQCCVRGTTYKRVKKFVKRFCPFTQAEATKDEPDSE